MVVCELVEDQWCTVVCFQPEWRKLDTRGEILVVWDREKTLDALLVMLVDECKIWKLPGAKASESLEFLHHSE